jgi:signal transduction histidine kinase
VKDAAIESVKFNAEQLAELHRICERLAYIGGGSIPPQLGTPAELINTLRMLTEICGRRATRNRQQEELRDAEDVERLKARFIRNVSHELRTPLACIDGFARALSQMENGHQPENNTPATRQQFLSIISQEAQRLGKMIEDVLDLSEIESVRRRPEQSIFSSKSLFDDALNSLGKPCSFAGVTMRLKPEGTGPSIYADRPTMIEVMRQLLNNACKFSAGQEVVLGAEVVSIGPDRFTQASESGLQERVTSATQLYVKDKGIGIAPEDLGRIFDKFYRSDKVSGNFPGAGLGLSIVRALVSQNGGQVWADSEVGRGSTFYVLVPNSPPGN